MIDNETAELMLKISNKQCKKMLIEDILGDLQSRLELVDFVEASGNDEINSIVCRSNILRLYNELLDYADTKACVSGVELIREAKKQDVHNKNCTYPLPVLEYIRNELGEQAEKMFNSSNYVGNVSTEILKLRCDVQDVIHKKKKEIERG